MIYPEHASILNEALSEYIECLLEDDDEFNNAIAKQAEEITIHDDGTWTVT